MSNSIYVKCIDTLCLSDKLKNILKVDSYYNLIIDQDTLPIAKLKLDDSDEVINVNINRFSINLDEVYFNKLTYRIVIGKKYGDTLAIAMNTYENESGSLYISDKNMMCLPFDENYIYVTSLKNYLSKIYNQNNISGGINRNVSVDDMKIIIDTLSTILDLPIKDKKKEIINNFIDIVSEVCDNAGVGVKIGCI